LNYTREIRMRGTAWQFQKAVASSLA